MHCSFWYDLLLMGIYLIVIVGGYFIYIYMSDQHDYKEQNDSAQRTLKRKIIANDLTINNLFDGIDQLQREIEQLQKKRAGIKKKNIEKKPIEAAATVDLAIGDPKEKK